MISSIPAHAPRAAKALLLAAATALGVCSLEPARAEAAPAKAAPVAAAGTSIKRLDPALDAIIPPGSVIEKVAGGFGFTEGPVWYRGEIRFSDLSGNKLYAVGRDGKVRMLMDHSGGPQEGPGGAYPGSNGSAVDRDGSVLMTQHGARRIVRVAPDMTVTPVLERNGDGRHLNSPNDVVYGPDGALWFTDPPLGLAKQDEDPRKEAPYNAVYRFKDGRVTAVVTDLHRPNGIGLSPDGSKLYVSNSGPEMFVNVYDVAPDGSVKYARRLISYPGTADDVPDGLKVDSRGNIWSTGPGGIRIITPEGKVLGQLKTPDLAQSNLAWGGPDWRTVYITAATNVYRLRIGVPGLKPMYAK